MTSRAWRSIAARVAMPGGRGLATRVAALGGRGLVGLAMACGPAMAADYSDGARGYGRAEASGDPPMPRYFPREGDETGPPRLQRPLHRVTHCIPRRVPIPTDAPGDPSYVGSAYGLGKPSYYGFTPPLGVDDPYGRPLLPYCP